MFRGSRLSRLQRCHRHSLFLPTQRPNRTHSAASVAVKAPLTSPLSGIQALIQTQINKSTHRGPALFSASLWKGICTAKKYKEVICRLLETTKRGQLHCTERIINALLSNTKKDMERSGLTTRHGIFFFFLLAVTSDDSVQITSEK